MFNTMVKFSVVALISTVGFMDFATAATIEIENVDVPDKIGRYPIAKKEIYFQDVKGSVITRSIPDKTRLALVDIPDGVYKSIWAKVELEADIPTSLRSTSTRYLHLAGEPLDWQETTIPTTAVWGESEIPLRVSLYRDGDDVALQVAKPFIRLQ